MILLGVLVVIAFLLWHLLPRESRSEARSAANRIFRVVAWLSLFVWVSCVVGFFFSIGDFKPGTETAVPVVRESIGFIFGFIAWAIGSIGVLATRRRADPNAIGYSQLAYAHLVRSVARCDRTKSGPADPGGTTLLKTASVVRTKRSKRPIKVVERNRAAHTVSTGACSVTVTRREFFAEAPMLSELFD